MPNILDEYLIKLGSVVDTSAMARFHNALREATQAVSANAMTISSSLLKTQAELVSGFMAIGGAALGLADKVANADQEYRLFAMHMYMSKDAARSLKVAMDALGQPLENLSWDPELRGRTKQLIADQRAMVTSDDFEAQMHKIRDVRFEFTRMEVEIKYLGMHVVQDFMKALGLGPDTLLKKLRQFNAWVTHNLPQISAWIVQNFLPIWKDVCRIAEDVWQVIKDLVNLFDNFVGIFSGGKMEKGEATFEKFARSVETVVHWLANVCDFLLKITGLLSGALVGGTVGGLLGSIIGGIAGIPGGPVGIAAGILGGGAIGTGIGAGGGALIGGAWDLYRHFRPQGDVLKSVPGVTPETWKSLANTTNGVVKPETLAAIVHSESGSRGMSAVSPKGAIGFMQLMPDTAKQYGVDPHDPMDNLRGGTAAFRDLMIKYKGDEAKALGAYNAGSGRMDAFLAGKATLPNETKNYIANTMRSEGHTGDTNVTVNVTQPNASAQQIADVAAAKVNEANSKRVQRTQQLFNQSAWAAGGSY